METNRTQMPDPEALQFAADDPRVHFAGAVGLATHVIGAVRPDQLGDPTPCPDLDVRGLLGHMVEVLQRVAALGRGDDPFAHTRSDAGGDGWRQAWLAAAHDVQTAWTDDAVLERVMTLPWMQAPGGIVLRGYVAEVTVHTWDLATATGQSPAWSTEVLEVAFSSLRAGLPAEGRRAAFDAVVQQMAPELRPSAPPFDDVVAVPAEAALLDRIVAWTGRRPDGRISS